MSKQIHIHVHTRDAESSLIAKNSHARAMSDLKSIESRLNRFLAEDEEKKLVMLAKEIRSLVMG